MYVRFDTVIPGNGFDFFRCSYSAAGNYHLALHLTGTAGEPGRLAVKDANKSTLVLFGANTLQADTWHLFEIKFKKTNSSDLRLWLDGALILSTSGKDLDYGSTSARVEIRTQTGSISPTPPSPRCQVYCDSWYMRIDDESTATWIEFVGFETGDPTVEVELAGASTAVTTPAPPSSKETYVCKVIAASGADPDN